MKFLNTGISKWRQFFLPAITTTMLSLNASHRLAYNYDDFILFPAFKVGTYRGGNRSSEGSSDLTQDLVSNSHGPEVLIWTQLPLWGTEPQKPKMKYIWFLSTCQHHHLSYLNKSGAFVSLFFFNQFFFLVCFLMSDSQVHYEWWRRILKYFWMSVVIYTMLVLIFIYTYQFENFPGLWQNMTGLKKEK